MLKIIFSFDSFYIPMLFIVTISLFGIITHYSNAQLSRNMTVCINGNCTTTRCVNDQPCKTTNSNSTNSTSLDDLLNNKTVLPPISPGEIV